jgi:hypothetical protein
MMGQSPDVLGCHELSEWMRNSTPGEQKGAEWQSARTESISTAVR